MLVKIDFQVLHEITFVSKSFKELRFSLKNEDGTVNGLQYFTRV